MTWRSEVETVFGAPVAAATRCHGGDLSEVLRADLADGRVMAVKRGPLAGQEARMLQAMRLAGAPVPEVLHQGGALLCLEWLEETAPSDAGWRALGTGLRKLHGFTGATFGWPEDYAFGPLHIDNGPSETWPSFWAAKRLLPFCPDLPPTLAHRLERLAHRLPDLLPARPQAALLHGDLWTGNALFSGPAAFLIDPACYHGDAEVDLAMLELFGPPAADFWKGYGDPAPDRAARTAAYQLWPALVHLRLFGDGYRPMVARLLDHAGV